MEASPMNKTTPRPLVRFTNPQRGSVLVAVMVVSAILTLAAGGYLTYLNHEYYLNYRSLHWTQALHLCETGIEDGIQEINFKYIKGAGFASADGWQPIGGAVIPLIPLSAGDSGYSKTVTGFTDTNGNVIGDYTIQVINPTGLNPILVSKATVTNHPYGKAVSRMVKCTSAERALFQFAIFSDGMIDLKGNNASTNSYNSSDPNHSTNGAYDPNKALQNGSIGTNGSVINVGNADIYGDAATGPGGTVNLKNNGTVSGVIRDDTRVDLPAAELPTGFVGTSLPAINTTTTLTAGDYVVPSINLSGKSMLYLEGNVRIHVTGDLSISGQGQINSASTSNVAIYLGGPSASVGGNGIINNGTPGRFQIYGLPGLTSLSLGGNGVLSATVYAPNAELTVVGNGEITGSIVAKSVILTGNASIHFDEALLQSGPKVGFRAQSWQEIPVAQP
jgi:hypothetical protein